MSSENASADWETPVTVEGEQVTLERKLSRKDDEVIATLEVHLTGDEPVEVEIVEDVPDEWAVDEVGIHPKHMPRDFEATNGRFRFVDEVADDEPLEVVYGIKLKTSDSVSPPGPPVIEREGPVSEPEEPSDRGFLGDSLGGGDEEEPVETFRRGAESSTASTRDDGMWDRDPDDSRESADRGSPASELRDVLASEGPDVDLSDRESLLGREGPLLGGSGPDEDLVEALADEIESGAASESALETLRTALRGDGSQRDSVRLNHLQSRVEEFAAYAETLGDAIDEHGPLDEFLSDQAAKVTELEAGHETLRERVEDTATDVETVQNRLSALDERVEAVDDVADEVEGVRKELDQLRRHHGDDVRDLESAIDDLESSYDEARGELASELDELRSDVQGWDATRRRLAEALEPDGAFDFESADRS